jgi:hypothetical protein
MTRAVVLAGFAVLSLAAITLEMLARLGKGRVPTSGAIVDWVMRHPASRSGLLGGWLWIGWHLFVR